MAAGVDRVRAVADGHSARRTAVSPFAHLLSLPSSRGRQGGRAETPVSFTHLVSGFAATSRAMGRRPAADLPVTTAVPPTHQPMGEAERRAYHTAAKAESARWMAVVAALPRADLLPAAVSLMQSSYEPSESVIETLQMIAQTTPPAPPQAAAPPRSGAERLAARVAEHQASVAAAQSPSAEVAALAERADATDFASFAARTMAKVRDPDAPPRPMPLRSPR